MNKANLRESQSTISKRKVGELPEKYLGRNNSLISAVEFQILEIYYSKTYSVQDKQPI